ncbi:hypothetical protein I3843_06G036200 [Carya illinoinensis]|nr:hypothetical protein I3843_06G036200 [Carya illinoinensis]
MVLIVITSYKHRNGPHGRQMGTSHHSVSPKLLFRTSSHIMNMHALYMLFRKPSFSLLLG